MGSSLSNSADATNGPPITGGSAGLGDIPESCVACVFLYLTPPEICKLARLNHAFRGAAEADSVWASKLSPNYQDLLDLMPPERYRNLSKKAIFSLLSCPVPFHDGNKEVWLDKVTGRFCMSISTKSMIITGIDDRRYWNWIATEESRFQVVAYLQQVWWFEADGEVKFRFPADIYTLSFRIHLGRYGKRLGRRVCSYEDTHGWDIKPVKFEFWTSDGQHVLTERYLDDYILEDLDHDHVHDNEEYDDANGEHHDHKRGCWIEYKVGDFTVSDSNQATELRFSMKQIDCTHSKGGLCLDSVNIAPRDLKALRHKLDRV
ncbi:F-box protein PP2-A15-like [Impatiens glandulifera]|uniref:F-box protein PP2-A15-like n=1 Tax=Impatiens glandulifera TaxID=253017 RepID=UPI001FB1130E|nr:F-box protein PP2-A15-like [Impatiens glandulifera]